MDSRFRENDEIYFTGMIILMTILMRKSPRPSPHNSPCFFKLWRNWS